MPGAIVSLDWADPPGSWRWAGPAWTGQAAPHTAGAITGLTIEVKEPLAAAQRWATALGLHASEEGDAALVAISTAGQILRFVALAGDRGEGITELSLAGPDVATLDIAGVRFVTGTAP